MKFYFIYKSLAHPELVGDYIQPFTHDERLAHARRAAEQLGSTIPWFVDPIDNRLKHAMGDRPNSEFVVDPRGIIVRKRAWSDPVALRADLEELVGSVENITKVEDLNLTVKEPLTVSAPKRVIERVSRAGLFPLVCTPHIEESGAPFYAKLRAEADVTVIDQGQGKLYLGFHLDPFHHAHWNNLQRPLRFELDVPTGVRLSQTTGESTPPENVDVDSDPREFLLDVESWPEDQTIHLTVTYAACTEDACHRVRQEYVLYRQRDRDGGRAGPAGFRGLQPEAMLKILMEGDKNRDGKLERAELNSVNRLRFHDYDLNGDGVLDQNELQRMAERPSESGPIAAPRPEPANAGAGREMPTAEDLLARIPAEKRTADTEAMIRAIAAGEMGPNQGWYKPGESRFGWDWLRSRYDADGDQAITRDEYTGPAETFARLDRDRSRQIQKDDFDWSDQSPWMQELQQATRLFRRLDDSSDGRLDRDEWLAAFERLSGGEDAASPEALRDLLFPPSGPGERPSLDVLIGGLASGEIGSHLPGPAVGDPAPDFELRTHDGERVIRLSEFRGNKPVVLIFGSFT